MTANPPRPPPNTTRRPSIGVRRVSPPAVESLREVAREHRRARASRTGAGRRIHGKLRCGRGAGRCDAAEVAICREPQANRRNSPRWCVRPGRVAPWRFRQGSGDESSIQRDQFRRRPVSEIPAQGSWLTELPGSRWRWQRPRPLRLRGKLHEERIFFDSASHW